MLIQILVNAALVLSAIDFSFATEETIATIAKVNIKRWVVMDLIRFNPVLITVTSKTHMIWIVDCCFISTK